MRLNLKKCIFASNSVQYLGQTVTAGGIKPGKEKTEAIAKASVPESQKKLRYFLGLANYFRSYIPGFAKLAAPLFRLTKIRPGRKARRCQLRPTQRLMPSRGLSFQSHVWPFLVETGSTRCRVDSAQGDEKNAGGMGAVLLQAQADGTKRPVGFAS